MSAYCGCITIFPSLSTIPYFPSFFVLNEFSIPDIAVISSYSVGIISFPVNLDDIEVTIEKILNKKTA